MFGAMLKQHNGEPELATAERSHPEKPVRPPDRRHEDALCSASSRRSTPCRIVRPINCQNESDCQDESVIRPAADTPSSATATASRMSRREASRKRRLALLVSSGSRFGPSPVSPHLCCRYDCGAPHDTARRERSHREMGFSGPYARGTKRSWRRSFAPRWSEGASGLSANPPVSRGAPRLAYVGLHRVTSPAPRRRS
jgi:hypothetical protein